MYLREELKQNHSLYLAALSLCVWKNLPAACQSISGNVLIMTCVVLLLFSLYERNLFHDITFSPRYASLVFSSSLPSPAVPSPLGNQTALHGCTGFVVHLSYCTTFAG